MSTQTTSLTQDEALQLVRNLGPKEDAIRHVFGMVAAVAVGIFVSPFLFSYGGVLPAAVLASAALLAFLRILIAAYGLKDRNDLRRQAYLRWCDTIPPHDCTRSGCYGKKNDDRPASQLTTRS